MHVIGLGAGLLGTASAYHLRQLGHDVTVVDRQSAPAAETSFANGGQISVSHAEPWANPSAPLKVLRWLGQEDAPLLFRLRADPAQWRWGLRFLRECTPARTRQTSSRSSAGHLQPPGAAAAAPRPRPAVRPARAGHPALLHQPEGVRRRRGAGRADARAGLWRVISADEAVRIEPALRHIRPQLAGATFTSEDESGDARQFTLALAERCRQDGVRFLTEHGYRAGEARRPIRPCAGGRSADRRSSADSGRRGGRRRWAGSAGAPAAGWVSI